MKARALWIETPRKLSYRFEEVSSPQANKVLIEAICSGISAGTSVRLNRLKR